MNKTSVVSILLLATGLWACGGASPTSKTIQAGIMPESGTFDGVYHSQAYGRLEITVTGGQAVGLYEHERFRGKIEGEIDGDVLHFRWVQYNEDLHGKVRETSGRGYFRYEIREEGTATKSRQTHFLVGEWGYGSDNAGHKWESVKFPPNTKKVLTLDGTMAGAETAGKKADPFSSGGKSAPSSDGSADAPPSSGGGLDDEPGGIADDLF